MMLRLGLALLSLCAVTAGQESRRIAESRAVSRAGASGFIYVNGATEAGDQVFRVDAESLEIAGTFAVDGGPTYAKLTPDGTSLIVATKRSGINATRGVTYALVPAGFDARWKHASDEYLSWRGSTAYPFATDATVPDAVSVLHLDSFDLPTREDFMSWFAEVVRTSGVRTTVPLPDHTTWHALWKKGEQTSIIAATSWNHVWRIDVATGEMLRITKAPLAPSSWLEPFAEGGLLIDGLVVVQAKNEAICFMRPAEAFVVDLTTGEARRRALHASPLAGRRIAFVRHSEKAHRFLVCRQSDALGGDLFVLLDPDLRETASMAMMSPESRFLDAAFSGDGKTFVTLGADGTLLLHDTETAEQIKRSRTALPLLPNGMYGASIAGWK